MTDLWHTARAAFLRRFFRLGEIQEEIARCSGRYLDVRAWARMTDIPEEQARQELTSGVKQGRLTRQFLYEGPDAPEPFLVPPEYLGKSVRLSDLGFEDEDQELNISPCWTREVFVAALK